MAPGPSGIKKRRVIDKESRAIIASVYRYLKEEYRFMKDHNYDNCDLSPLANVSKRVAEAVGCGEKTITRILQESSTEFVEPMKKRKARRKRPDLENITPYVIRSAIFKYQTTHKRTLTTLQLMDILKNTYGYGGCYNTLRNALKSTGYKLCRTDTSKRRLIEKQDLQIWRFKYLNKILQYRAEDRPIVYTGVKLAYKSKAGMCYTIAHAGTKDGFIQNCLLIHRAYARGQNESNMNYEEYSMWVTEKLLSNIPKNAVVVVEHANYNDCLNNLPNINSTKTEIITWLAEHNIAFEENLHKIELYDIVKKNKDRFTPYKIDEIIHKAGVDVLRIPPKHPELNAIHVILDKVESHVACHSGKYKNLNEAKDIYNNAVDSIPINMWEKSCTSVVEIEKTYMEHFNIDLEEDIYMHEDDSTSHEEESASEEEASDAEEEEIQVKQEIEVEVEKVVSVKPEID